MIRLRPVWRLRIGTGQASAGFLVAEMLVAMAISAFLLVALLSAVSLTVRSFDRTSRVGEELETTNRVLSSLSRDLALASRATFAGEDAGYVFLGTRDRVVYAYDLVRDGLGETRVSDLAGVRSPGGFALSRREALFVPSSSRLEDLVFDRAESVYTGRAVLRFAYFEALPDGGEVLLDEWVEPAKLPVAIRVTLWDEGSGAPELSLRIPLLITAEPGCAAPDAGGICLSIEPAIDAGPGEEVAGADDAQDWRRYVQ